MTIATQQMLPFETRLTYEQKNLVRFCAHLTGDAQAAEDLTQETLRLPGFSPAGAAGAPLRRMVGNGRTGRGHGI